MYYSKKDRLIEMKNQLDGDNDSGSSISVNNNNVKMNTFAKPNELLHRNVNIQFTGENPNDQNAKGETALHIAVAAGHEANAWRLCKHENIKAKLTIRDNNGNTPLKLMLIKMPRMVKKVGENILQ